MERSADGLGEMLQRLGIQQPKLEDAGLEDCALPPHSIMEAFSRAATSLKSRVVGDEPDGDDCVQDPGPTNGETSDTLVDGGIVARPCGGGNVTAGGEEGGGDRVVVPGDEAEWAEDRVLVLGRDERACCPGDGNDVIGGEKKGDLDADEGERDGGDDEKPILDEALI